MEDSQAMMAALVVPYIILLGALAIAFAIGNGFVAARLGKSVALWVILSLIPLVNIFFFYYVAYAVILGMLRRLNAIADRVGAAVAPT